MLIGAFVEIDCANMNGERSALFYELKPWLGGLAQACHF
ncbi:hypothetical protein DT23_03645 [Thioclava indica]|uniref:Uncharacterized protein n=1 Tax=Thioclava indica TaxID=1353528 RepID=A0A074KGE6_9RHOB|nr:hypothetical protein DT23_03645 [Thioclava indica]